MSITEDSINTLVNRQLSVIVNDPWDFSKVWGEWREARVVAVGYTNVEPQSQAILVRLSGSVEYLGVQREYFVAVARYREHGLSELEAVGSVEASLTWLPDDTATHDRAFDLSSWRGGVAAIATLRLL